MEKEVPSVLCRISADLVAEARAIAEKTHTTPRVVYERAMRLGMKEEREFAATSAWGLEVLALLSKPGVRSVVEGLLGQPLNDEQLRRVEGMRVQKKAKSGRVVPG